MKTALAFIASLLSIFLEVRKILLFLGFFFLGSVLLGYSAEPPAKAALIESSSSMVEQAPFGNAPELFLFIFSRNSFAAVSLFISGITIALSLLILLSQGMLIGAVIFSAQRVSELGGGASPLIGILPHGIMEIPAILLSAALGIRLGLKVFLKKRYLPGHSLRSLFKASALSMFRVVIPLLLISAFVEVIITPDIIELASVQASDDAYLLDRLPSESEVNELGYSYREADQLSLSSYSFWQNISISFRKSLLNDSFYSAAAADRERFAAKAFELGNGSIGLASIHGFKTAESAARRMELQKGFAEGFLRESGFNHSIQEDTYTIQADNGEWRWSFWISGSNFYQLYIKGSKKDFEAIRGLVVRKAERDSG